MQKVGVEDCANARGNGVLAFGKRRLKVLAHASHTSTSTSSTSRQLRDRLAHVVATDRGLDFRFRLQYVETGARSDPFYHLHGQSAARTSWE